jgi:N-acetylglucosaminyldiphosphoundecaprenol N-acetyl-beta-D-mannosaminyltransferase
MEIELKFLLTTYSDLDLFVRNTFLSNNGLILSYFNQYTFNTYFSDKKFREIFNEIKFYQEGIGCFWGLKFLGIDNLERLDATNINERIFIKLIKESKRIFLIGNNFDEKFVEEKIFKQIPNIVGYQNGYFEEGEIFDIAQRIKNLKAEFVLLAMGQPKQEFIALRLRELLPDLNYYCVGNFFNFCFGIQKRAPIWIRKLQLEWFYRFLLEPKRMFKRYIIGIPIFFVRLIKLKIKLWLLSL